MFGKNLTQNSFEKWYEGYDVSDWQVRCDISARYERMTSVLCKYGVMSVLDTKGWRQCFVSKVWCQCLISSTDLVLAVRGQKNGGGGRGMERRKRDLVKYDCVGQNLAHASTAHALMLWCVQYRHRVRYRVAFSSKKRGSLNLKPKTQALIYFEDCSAAGQHVLAVLSTGYGKIWQIYEQLLPNMSEIGMFQCCEVEEQGLSQLLFCRYRPLHSRFRVWKRVRPVLFYSYSVSSRLGRKSRRNTWKAWPRPMFTALSDY